MSDHRVTSRIIEGPEQRLPIEFRTHTWIKTDGRAVNCLSISTRDAGFSTHFTFTAAQASALAADLLIFAENIEATEREAEMGGLKP